MPEEFSKPFAAPPNVFMVALIVGAVADYLIPHPKSGPFR